MTGSRYTKIPKKMAKISIDCDGNDVRGWTERHGERFFEVKAKLTGKFNHEMAQESIMRRLKANPDILAYNYKYFTSPDLEGFDYKPRLIKEVVKSNPKSIEAGEAELKLRSSVHDPWGDVEIVRILGAVYTVSDNTMLPASVIAEVDQVEFMPYSLMKIDAG